MIIEYSRERRIAIRLNGICRFVPLCHFRQKHTRQKPLLKCHETKSPVGSGLGIKLGDVPAYLSV